MICLMLSCNSYHLGLLPYLLLEKLLFMYRNFHIYFTSGAVFAFWVQFQSETETCLQPVLCQNRSACGCSVCRKFHESSVVVRFESRFFFQNVGIIKMRRGCFLNGNYYFTKRCETCETCETMRNNAKRCETMRNGAGEKTHYLSPNI